MWRGGRRAGPCDFGCAAGGVSGGGQTCLVVGVRMCACVATDGPVAVWTRPTRVSRRSRAAGSDAPEKSRAEEDGGDGNPMHAMH
ncbi:MAG: hypothetical protein ACPIOQ_16925 [Promethearchaeia archaeon]